NDERVADEQFIDERAADERIADDEPIVDDGVIADEPVVRAGLQSPEFTAGRVASEYTDDEYQEEVVTPQPLPASPFKVGADESNLDRFKRQVTDVPIDIRPTEGDMPDDLAAQRSANEPTIDETWSEGEPSGIFCSYTPWTICYRPLYFEDIP